MRQFQGIWITTKLLKFVPNNTFFPLQLIAIYPLANVLHSLNNWTLWQNVKCSKGAFLICQNWPARPFNLETECTILKDNFFPSDHVWKFLRHHLFKMTHSIAHFENEWWPGSRVTDQGIVKLFGGDAECDDNSQRPPKPSHNHLGSYSGPRLSLFSKVGYLQTVLAFVKRSKFQTLGPNVKKCRSQIWRVLIRSINQVNLLPRILRLFGQRLVAMRDSGVLVYFFTAGFLL